MHQHRPPIKEEGPCRTQGDTNPTVGALCIVSPDILTEWLDPYPEILKVIHSSFIVPFKAAQLEDQNTFFPRSYACLQDIENQVIILDQLVDYGLVNKAWGKVQYYPV